MSRIPNLFIVGAPKCGTTALSSYLASHPDIFMAGKEYHHFGSDLAFQHQERSSDVSYLSHFEGVESQRYVLDASIGYLVSKRAAAEICARSPDSRVIAILRNPVDMMHSLHSELLFQGDEDVADFPEALRLEDARSRGEHLPPTCQSLWALQYRECARFAGQLTRYLEVFGKDRVHTVLLDDVRTDVATAYGKLLEFLDIDASFRPEFPVVNANKVARSEFIVKLMRTPPPFVRRLGRLVVPDPNARRLLGVKTQNLNASKKSRRPMDPALRDALREEFRDEVCALGDLLGRDLSSWSNPTPHPA